MAIVILDGKYFTIPDEQEKSLRCEIDQLKRHAIERSKASQLHGKMVFASIDENNSDYHIRSRNQSENRPIFVIFRAVISKQRSVLWMPNFSLKTQDIKPLQDFYPLLESLAP